MPEESTLAGLNELDQLEQKLEEFKRLDIRVAELLRLAESASEIPDDLRERAIAIAVEIGSNYAANHLVQDYCPASAFIDALRELRGQLITKTQQVLEAASDEGLAWLIVSSLDRRDRRSGTPAAASLIAIARACDFGDNDTLHRAEKALTDLRLAMVVGHGNDRKVVLTKKGRDWIRRDRHTTQATVASRDGKTDEKTVVQRNGRKQVKTYETALRIYTKVKQLGQGGNGVVEMVRDDAGREYAVKLVRTGGLSKERVRRLGNEIALGWRLQHVNIVKTLDHGYFDDENGRVIFYVMPLYPQVLRRQIGSLQPSEAFRIARGMASALAYAHSEGVWHRDLKPENVALEADGSPVLLDFGIAHISEDLLITPVETRENTRFGNFQYAAPEQRVRGKMSDDRADIYVFGMMLNELFTGIVPEGENHKLIADVFPAYAKLDALVGRMRSHDPVRRPDAKEVLATLEALAEVPVSECAAEDTDFDADERDSFDKDAHQADLEGAPTLSAGRVRSLTWDLDAEVFEEKIIDLLQKRNSIPIRLFVEAVGKEAKRKFASGDVDNFRMILDRIAILAAVGVRLDHEYLLDQALSVFLGIYDDLHTADVESMPVPREALWLDIIERVYGIGGVAVRNRCWAAVRRLVLGMTFDGLRGRRLYWLRHAVTQGARAGILRSKRRGGSTLPELGINRAKVLEALHSDLDPDDDALVNSIVQFDLLACAVVIHETEDEHMDHWIPEFVYWSSNRVEPAVALLISDERAREVLTPTDDAGVAHLSRVLDAGAREVAGSRYSWNGWETPGVYQFLKANP